MQATAAPPPLAGVEPATADERAPDPSNGVAVAYVYDETVDYSWHHSVVELIGYDLANQCRLMQGGYIAIHYGTGGLVQARNMAVKVFLEERPNADWLLWLDTDMGFPADVVDQLMSVADPVERPVVGALCFIQRQLEPDGMGGFATSAQPSIFDWKKVDKKAGFVARLDYSRDTVTQAAGTGSACVLIHRSALERVKVKHGESWYDPLPNHSMGEMTSEDLSFCMRLGSLGIPLFVHTGVKTTHRKSLWLSESDYIAQRRLVTAPPPATAETAVIVPVLGRPQNAVPFMASLRASTGLARVYAVVGPEETEEAHQASEAAWRAAGAEVLACGGLTFAEKVNHGYRETKEPWLFLVGDDVRFHPGWLDHAQAAAGDRFHVVGTNDLGSERVRKGEHATHMLIRRKYVDGMGASWDGPGVVAHEGYRHWFIDDELVIAAKQRGVWTPATASIVEHLHPYFGKGEIDDVYRLGAASAEQDKELFAKRCEANL